MPKWFSRVLFIASLCAALAAANLNAEETEKPNSGLLLKIVSEDKMFSDVIVTPNTTIYVPSGQAPGPFVPSGKFSASWTGFVSAELRGDYEFQALVNGSLKVEINGVVALDGDGTNSLIQSSKPVRLTKGTNRLAATFFPPASGDATLRLQWKPTDALWQPIPAAVLTHADSAELAQSAKIHLGRELFLEHRCIRCHGPAPQNGIPELSMDAPDFENLATRRDPAWIARWIADPKSLRTDARMPKMFRGEKAKENAAAIAAFFLSLKGADQPVNVKLGPATEGKNLFDTLHCEACHNAPDASDPDQKKIALKSVGEKFSAASLIEFLKQPDAHYSWIRMPRFRLTDAQRNSIAGYLLASQTAAKTANNIDTAQAERGKALLQTSGCLNCHSFGTSAQVKMENQFSAPKLQDMDAAAMEAAAKKTRADVWVPRWRGGCVAEIRPENSKAPEFNFSREEREALWAFADQEAKLKFPSLQRNVPQEFAARQSRNLNCRNCHGEVEGLPVFEILGAKLKPEWAGKFINGELNVKPRPWREDQMPAFAKFGVPLAEGLAMQNGFPPQTPPEAHPAAETAINGQKLVSAPPIGFGCVQCHAVGSTAAMQAFEAPGINLALAGARLQPSYFRRWVRNPPSIDPLTKMPLFFADDGKSPLADYYAGDAMKQIEAIWSYLQLGEKMPAPKTP